MVTLAGGQLLPVPPIKVPEGERKICLPFRNFHFLIRNWWGRHSTSIQLLSRWCPYAVCICMDGVHRLRSFKKCARKARWFWVGGMESLISINFKSETGDWNFQHFGAQQKDWGHFSKKNSLLFDIIKMKWTSLLLYLPIKNRPGCGNLWSCAKVVPQLLPVLILQTENAIYWDVTKVQVFCSSLCIEWVLAKHHMLIIAWDTPIRKDAVLPTPTEKRKDRIKKNKINLELDIEHTSSDLKATPFQQSSSKYCLSTTMHYVIHRTHFPWSFW